MTSKSHHLKICRRSLKLPEPVQFCPKERCPSPWIVLRAEEKPQSSSPSLWKLASELSKMKRINRIQATASLGVHRVPQSQVKNRRLRPQEKPTEPETLVCRKWKEHSKKWLSERLTTDSWPTCTTVWSQWFH